MKKIIIVFAVLFLFSCNYKGHLKSSFETLEIEGCEYIFFPEGNSQMITHKGNCKNPIHIYKRVE